MNSKPEWRAPEVTRRSRSMVLSGYQAEHDDENEDEDNELLIDEDEKGPSPDELNQAMNDAETSKDTRPHCRLNNNRTDASVFE